MGGTMCCVSRDEKQIGRSILSLPWYITDRFTDAVQSAENRLGQPPNALEVFVTIEELGYNDYLMAVNGAYECAAILFSILREDMVFTDKVGYRFTCKKQEGYFTYTEIFNMKYPGYILGPDQECFPGPKTKSVDFAEFFSMMRSTDAAQLENLRWMFDGEFRFLNQKNPVEPQKVGYLTFPRSGNSYLRRVLESVSGIATGANVHLHTSTSLQIQGLPGEYVVDDRVWIIKSHHPGIIPRALPFTCNKILGCVRNPLDVFQSYACYMNTMNHSMKPDFDFEKDYPDWWDWFVRTQTIVMKKWFEQIIDECETRQINPVFFTRYEDLVVDMASNAGAVLEYLFDLESIEGTNAQRRLQEFVAKGTKGAQVYQTKATTGVANAHAHRYTESQIAFIKQELGPMLYYFGYVNSPIEGEDNNTAFFTFEEHDPANVERYYQFRKTSQLHKEMVAKGDMHNRKYDVTKNTTLDLVDPTANILNQEPGKADARKRLNYEAREPVIEIPKAE